MLSANKDAQIPFHLLLVLTSEFHVVVTLAYAISLIIMIFLFLGSGYNYNITIYVFGTDFVAPTTNLLKHSFCTIIVLLQFTSEIRPVSIIRARMS